MAFDSSSPSNCPNASGGALSSTNPSSCMMAITQLGASKVAFGIQLANFSVSSQRSLFNISLIQNVSSSACSAVLQFSYDGNRIMNVSGERFNFATSFKVLHPGDRIALVSIPLLRSFQSHSDPRIYYELWNSISEANSEMNSTKAIGWELWGVSTSESGCASVLRPQLTLFNTTASVQSIYLQVAERGAVGEPSLGQNLIPDGGAESGVPDDRYWGVDITPNNASFDGSLTVVSPGRNSSRAFFLSIGVTQTENVSVGVRSFAYSPVLLPEQPCALIHFHLFSSL